MFPLRIALTASALAASLLATPAVAQPYGPDTCAPGFVWREAIPSDHVCVTGASRSLVAQENAQAAARRNPNGNSGSNSCAQGLVWREAFAGDKVCITPSRRNTVATENRLAPSRLASAVAKPKPAQKAYGPDTCIAGFVWREAIPSDHVCVRPGSRQLVAEENRSAASRRNPSGPYGSNTCIQGYVWREAFAGDKVCVTPARRSVVALENRNPASRRAP